MKCLGLFKMLFIYLVLAYNVKVFNFHDLLQNHHWSFITILSILEQKAQCLKKALTRSLLILSLVNIPPVSDCIQTDTLTRDWLTDTRLLIASYSQADDDETVMNVLSNFGDGRPVFGLEVMMKNFATLDSDSLKGWPERRYIHFFLLVNFLYGAHGSKLSLCH